MLIGHNTWIELLPAPPRIVPLAAQCRRLVTVSISRQTSGLWAIVMRNNTTGEDFRTAVAYDSSLSSAEWVEEAPATRLRIIPLEDFGAVTFTNGSTTRNGQDCRRRRPGRSRSR